jgi:hypothetical protein
MADGYTFVIITDSDEPEKLEREIESIHALSMPAYEILTVRDVDRSGKLGKLRNAGCRQSLFDHLVVADDDMIFHDDFYRGLQAYGEDYDVLSCKLLNPDGTRYWDWKAHQDGKNWLLEYGETSPLVSVTGGLVIMKIWVFDMVQWDERRGFYQEEDVDFSNRLKKAGIRISFNPYSTVTHEAPYTQVGGAVIRTEEQQWQFATV